MIRLPSLFLLALACTLAGCDPSRDEPPPDVEDTVFDEQVRALDKARSVEDIQDERLKKLRDSEESASGN
jgi:hypothetical protein